MLLTCFCIKLHCRLESLAASEQALLTALMTFIETHLIPMGGGSHEKKGVALKLILELVRLVPVALLPVVLSQRVVRTLVSIRGNNKHTLFELAGATLQELVRIAGVHLVTPYWNHCALNILSQDHRQVILL